MSIEFFDKEVYSKACLESLKSLEQVCLRLERLEEWELLKLVHIIKFDFESYFLRYSILKKDGSNGKN